MIISGKTYYMELSLQKILKQLVQKIYAIFYRLLDVFRYLPDRLGRVFDHIYQGVKRFRRNNIQSVFRRRIRRGILYWWFEFFLLVVDCLGISELFETVMDFVKFNSRTLNPWERDMAYDIFGDSINYDRVRLDEYALIGPRQKLYCYVSFFMVNSWGSMHNSVLIHELVHVWQYQHMGIVYIPRALHAQRTIMGYDYGGLENLRTYYNKGRGLKDFNLEQQADIIMDYYRIKNGYPPQWGSATIADLQVYEYFVQQLKEV